MRDILDNLVSLLLAQGEVVTRGIELADHVDKRVDGKGIMPVCSGVISHELNGPGIISIPLDVDEYMEIGIITRKNTTLTRYGQAYIDAIRQHI